MIETQSIRNSQGSTISGMRVGGIPILALCFLAVLPLILIHAFHLWSTTYAKAFPFVYAGIAFYLWRVGYEPSEPSGWRKRWGVSSIWLGTILGLTSVLFDSPLLGQLAFLSLLSTALVQFFPRVPFHRLLKVLLLGAFLAIPSALSNRLQDWFNETSLRFTSHIMEYFRIAHLKSGESIETPTTTFHIVRDGYGIEAIYIAGIVLAISWLLRNRGLLPSLLELAVVPFVALTNVTLRAFVYLFAKDWVGIDWSSGWSHWMFHALSMLVSAGSIWLILHGIRLVMREIPPPSNRDETPLGAEVFNRLSRWPWPTGSVTTRVSNAAPKAAPIGKESTATSESIPALEPKVTWPQRILNFSVLAWLLGTILFSAGVLLSLRSNSHSAWYNKAIASWEKVDWKLEEVIVPMESSKNEIRTMGHPLGELSRVWQGATPDGIQIQIGLDLGDEGRLQPIDFYLSSGWKIPQTPTQVAKPSTDGGTLWTWEMEKSNPELKAWGMVLHQDDVPLNRSGESSNESVGSRLMTSPLFQVLGLGRKNKGAVQVSMVLISNSELSPQQKSEWQSWFEKESPKLAAQGKEAIAL